MTPARISRELSDVSAAADATDDSRLAVKVAIERAAWLGVADGLARPGVSA
jgi:hypothetical protein